MGLVKCSRCELNYMEESEKMCQICKKELKGEAEPEETLEVCTECNEHPVVPGEELCLLCLKEKIRQESGNREDVLLEEEGLYDEENEDDVEEIEVDAKRESSSPKIVTRGLTRKSVKKGSFPERRKRNSFSSIIV